MISSASPLSSVLFDNGFYTYAVLDGAGIPGLRGRMEDCGVENVCLYRGNLEPELLNAAPHLVRMERRSPFSNWVLQNGWGNNWGVFALTTSSIQAVATHFRKLLIVTDPAGEKLYFRYYDPRVFRIFLPTCNEQDLVIIFGSIDQFVLESEISTKALAFTVKSSVPSLINV